MLHTSDEFGVQRLMKAVEACCRRADTHLSLSARSRLSRTEKSKPWTAPRNSTEYAPESSSSIRIKENSTSQSTIRAVRALMNPGMAGVTVSEVSRTRDVDIIFKVREATPGDWTIFADILRKNTGLEIDVNDAAGSTTTILRGPLPHDVIALS